MNTVSKELFKVFCDVGFPKIIQSDNGTEFVNAKIRKLFDERGIRHQTAPHILLKEMESQRGLI